MLINIKDQLTPELRHELAKEFERVLSESTEIRHMHDPEQRTQRIVLTLPADYIRMAKFLAVLENVEELAPALTFLEHAGDNATGAQAMKRKLNAMMRAYLEEVLMTRIGVEMCELKAALKADDDQQA